MSAPVLVFDLDDTLYLERDFARSGFRAAAACLPGTADRHRFAALCLAILDEGGRGRIFDRGLAELGLAATPHLVARLVTTYRGHDPDIALAADARRYLGARDARLRGALITDGPAATQEAKIRALSLRDLLGCVVCTGALGPGFGKPHPRAFEIVESWAGAGAGAGRRVELVYVADNPTKDFVTPRARGWTTIEIRRPERIHRAPAPDRRHEAHAAIESFDDLDRCLRALGASTALAV